MKKLLVGMLVLIFVAAFVFYAIQNKPGSSTAVINNTDYVIPDTLKYLINKTYPHDTSSFTQGLLIYNGRLYEGTGENGRSKLLEVDLTNGKALRQISLDKKYFGEGITILNDTVYQLTWQNKVVFVYTLKGFKKIKEFQLNTEGWGITTDGKNLIVSDGSSNLYFYEPSTFHLLRTQGVTDAGALAYNMNELEYIDGYVYANQWQLPYIYKINPGNGQVVAKINLNDVWERIKIKDPQADVPNGIAYDTATKKIYITGKLWPELYEIQLTK
jgi:glutaminyl-peptide cyclotransferase